jgi:hypothetical protein
MHLMTLLAQSQADPAQIQQMVIAMMAILPIIVLVCLAVILVPFWFICKKAGLSPWLTLLNIVPLGGLVLIYILAFSEWKVAPAPPATWASGYPPPPPTV